VSVRVSLPITVTAIPEQGETLLDALARTREAVADPRFPTMADDAIERFGNEIRAFLGRADRGELLTPLDVWTGTQWEPGLAIITQDRAVLAWGQGGPARTQVIPRKRDPGGVTDIDIQSDAITLWIDCDQPLNVRILRFQPGMDVPQTFADKLRNDKSQAPTAVELPPADHQCPHCFEPVRADAEFCPACGRHIGPKPPRSKKWLIIALVALLVLLLLGIAALAVFGGDDKQPPAKTATPTASAAPTQAPPAATRRIFGPGWEGQAPRALKLTRSGGGNLRVHVLTGENGLVIRIFHTPKEKANPGNFEVGSRKKLKSDADSAELATVKNFGTSECAKRTCSDLLLNDPAWGGLAITVNATSGAKLKVAKDIAASITQK
jgi:hypothetical protein